MPTFADILKTNADTDGISFLPELTGKKQIETHNYLYWEFPENDGSIAIRMENWKGIIRNVHKGNKVLQLFDLYSDPAELFDVARQHPDIVARLEAKIGEAHVRAGVERFRFPLEK